MGNKKFKSTCPLIDKRKLINQKIIEGQVTAFGLLKYKNKEFILTGLSGGMIEVYDYQIWKKLLLIKMNIVLMLVM